MEDENAVELFIDLEGEKSGNPEKFYGDDEIEYDFKEEARQLVFRRRLFRTRNPLAAAPQVRTVCVKWAKPWPGAKICVGHKYQWRYMYTTGVLVVSLKDPKNILPDIEDCLRDSGIAAAVISIIAAIATGGAALSAAIALFVKIFKACLIAKFGDDIIDVSLDLQNRWGDWE